MKTKIVRIGNSQGIRIPKPLLDEAGLGEAVTLRVEEGTIVIESEGGTRAGWAEAAALANARGDDEPILAESTTRFDEEWEWE